MISGWRGDRRIGPVTLRESIGGMVRPALIILAIAAAGAALAVAIGRMDDPLDLFTNLRLWAVNFGVFILTIAIGSLFGPRKDLSIAIGLVGGLIAFLVWFMALLILSALGVVVIVPAP